MLYPAAEYGLGGGGIAGINGGTQAPGAQKGFRLAERFGRLYAKKIQENRS